MFSLFDDITVFHDEDEVCIPDGGQSVSNNEACSSFHQVIHCFLDADFGSGIYGAGCFV